MGWDVKATADAVTQAIPSPPSLPNDLTLPQAAHWVLITFLALAVAAVLIRLVPKVWKIVEETFLSNWRLALLGSAGTFAVKRFVLNDSCCAPGASCCYPGSPCCKGHNKQPLAER